MYAVTNIDKRCVQPSRLVVINNPLCLSDDPFLFDSYLVGTT